MTTATLERPESLTDDPVDVEVEALNGQQTVRFSRLTRSTRMMDIVGLSASSLALPPHVPWLLRDSRTARLLRGDQTLDEVAHESRARLALQPDVRLG